MIRDIVSGLLPDALFRAAGSAQRRLAQSDDDTVTVRLEAATGS